MPLSRLALLDCQNSNSKPTGPFLRPNLFLLPSWYFLKGIIVALSLLAFSKSKTFGSKLADPFLGPDFLL